MKLFKVFIIILVTSSAIAFASELKKEQIKISIGEVSLQVEVAKTPAERATGLMNRTVLKNGEGMLFVFEGNQTRSFWMKNTFIPLSIGFFDTKGVLVDMQDMEPVTSVLQTQIPQYRSRKPAKYALEVPRGWFSKVGIQLGDRLRLPSEPGL
ncbi:MAG: DUF192 domain-containing protein [Bdellovibrionales bacterium]